MLFKIIRNWKLKSGEYIYYSISPGKENRQEVDLKSFAHAAAEVTNMEDCGGDQLCYRGGAALHSQAESKDDLSSTMRICPVIYSSKVK